MRGGAHVTEGALGLANRAVFSPINGRSIRRAVNALRRKPGITWFNRHRNARTGLVEEFQVASGRLTFSRPSFSHQLGVPGRKAFLGVSLSAVNGLEHGAQQITRDDPSGAEWRVCIPTSMAGHARKIRKAKHPCPFSSRRRQRLYARRFASGAAIFPTPNTPAASSAETPSKRIASFRTSNTASFSRRLPNEHPSRKAFPVCAAPPFARDHIPHI